MPPVDYVWPPSPFWTAAKKIANASATANNQTNYFNEVKWDRDNGDQWDQIIVTIVLSVVALFVLLIFLFTKCGHLIVVPAFWKKHLWGDSNAKFTLRFRDYSGLTLIFGFLLLCVAYVLIVTFGFGASSQVSENGAIDVFHISDCYVEVQTKCDNPPTKATTHFDVSKKDVTDSKTGAETTEKFIEGHQTRRCATSICLEDRQRAITFRLLRAVIQFTDVAEPLDVVIMPRDGFTDPSKVYFSNTTLRSVYVNLTTAIVLASNLQTTGGDVNITVGFGSVTLQQTFETPFKVSGSIESGLYCVSSNLDNFEEIGTSPCIPDINGNCYSRSTFTASYAPSNAAPDVNGTTFNIDTVSLYLNDYVQPFDGGKRVSLARLRVAGDAMLTDLPRLSPFVLQQLKSTVDWRGTSSMDDYIQAVEVSTPATGMLFLQAKYRVTMEIRPEFLSFVSAGALQPQYRRLRTPTSHLQCDNLHIAPYFLEKSSQINLIFDTDTDHDEWMRKDFWFMLDTHLTKEMQLNLASVIKAEVNESSRTSVIAVVTPGMEFDLPYLFGGPITWPTYELYRNDDGSIDFKKLETSDIVIAMKALAVVVALTMASYVVILLFWNRLRIFSAFFLQDECEHMRAIAGFKGRCSYVYFASVSWVLAWMVFRICHWLVAGRSMFFFLEWYFTPEKGFLASRKQSKVEKYLSEVGRAIRSCSCCCACCVGKAPGAATGPNEAKRALDEVARRPLSRREVLTRYERWLACRYLHYKHSASADHENTTGFKQRSAKVTPGRIRIVRGIVERPFHAESVRSGVPLPHFSLDPEQFSVFFRITNNQQDFIHLDHLLYLALSLNPMLSEPQLLRALTDFGLKIDTRDGHKVENIVYDDRSSLSQTDLYDHCEKMEANFSSFPSFAYVLSHTLGSHGADMKWTVLLFFFRFLEIVLFTILAFVPFFVTYFGVSRPLLHQHNRFSTTNSALATSSAPSFLSALSSANAPTGNSAVSTVLNLLSAVYLLLLLAETGLALTYYLFQKFARMGDCKDLTSCCDKFSFVLLWCWWKIRVVVTLCTAILCTVFVFMSLTFAANIIIWWVLGVIVTPNRMIVYCTSVFTVLGATYHIYVVLNAMRGDINSTLKDQILRVLAAAMRAAPLVKLNPASNPAHDATAEDMAKKEVDFGAILDSISRGDVSTGGLQASLSDISTHIGLPTSVVALIFAVVTGDRTHVKEAARQIIRDLHIEGLQDDDPKFRSVVELVMLAMGDATVSSDCVIKAIASLLPKDMKSQFNTFKPEARALVHLTLSLARTNGDLSEEGAALVKQAVVDLAATRLSQVIGLDEAAGRPMLQCTVTSVPILLDAATNSRPFRESEKQQLRKSLLAVAEYGCNTLDQKCSNHIVFSLSVVSKELLGRSLNQCDDLKSAVQQLLHHPSLQEVFDKQPAHDAVTFINMTADVLLPSQTPSIDIVSVIESRICTSTPVKYQQALRFFGRLLATLSCGWVSLPPHQKELALALFKVVGGTDSTDALKRVNKLESVNFTDVLKQTCKPYKNQPDTVAGDLAIWVADQWRCIRRKTDAPQGVDDAYKRLSELTKLPPETLRLVKDTVELVSQYVRTECIELGDNQNEFLVEVLDSMMEPFFSLRINGRIDAVMEAAKSGHFPIDVVATEPSNQQLPNSVTSLLNELTHGGGSKEVRDTLIHSFLRAITGAESLGADDTPYEVAQAALSLYTEVDPPEAVIGVLERYVKIPLSLRGTGLLQTIADPLSLLSSLSAPQLKLVKLVRTFLEPSLLANGAAMPASSFHALRASEEELLFVLGVHPSALPVVRETLTKYTTTIVDSISERQDDLLTCFDHQTLRNFFLQSVAETTIAKDLKKDVFYPGHAFLRKYYDDDARKSWSSAAMEAFMECKQHLPSLNCLLSRVNPQQWDTEFQKDSPFWKVLQISMRRMYEWIGNDAAELKKKQAKLEELYRVLVADQVTAAAPGNGETLTDSDIQYAFKSRSPFLLLVPLNDQANECNQQVLQSCTELFGILFGIPPWFPKPNSTNGARVPKLVYGLISLLVRRQATPQDVLLLLATAIPAPYQKLALGCMSIFRADEETHKALCDALGIDQSTLTSALSIVSPLVRSIDFDTPLHTSVKVDAPAVTTAEPVFSPAVGGTTVEDQERSAIPGTPVDEEKKNVHGLLIAVKAAVSGDSELFDRASSTISGLESVTSSGTKISHRFLIDTTTVKKLSDDGPAARAVLFAMHLFNQEYDVASEQVGPLIEAMLKSKDSDAVVLVKGLLPVILNAAQASKNDTTTNDCLVSTTLKELLTKEFLAVILPKKVADAVTDLLPLVQPLLSTDSTVDEKTCLTGLEKFISLFGEPQSAVKANVSEEPDDSDDDDRKTQLAAASPKVNEEKKKLLAELEDKVREVPLPKRKEDESHANRILRMIKMLASLDHPSLSQGIHLGTQLLANVDILREWKKDFSSAKASSEVIKKKAKKWDSINRTLQEVVNTASGNDAGLMSVASLLLNLVSTLSSLEKDVGKLGGILQRATPLLRFLSKRDAKSTADLLHMMKIAIAEPQLQQLQLAVNSLVCVYKVIRARKAGGANFSSTARAVAGQVREAAAAEAHQVVDKALKYIFSRIDVSGDGKVCKEELCSAFQRLNFPIQQVHLEAIFDRLDTDGSGGITLEEFERFVDELQDLFRHMLLHELGLSGKRINFSVAFLGGTLCFVCSFLIVGSVAFGDGTPFTAVLTGLLPMSLGTMTTRSQMKRKDAFQDKVSSLVEGLFKKMGSVKDP